MEIFIININIFYKRITSIQFSELLLCLFYFLKLGLEKSPYAQEACFGVTYSASFPCSFWRPDKGEARTQLITGYWPTYSSNSEWFRIDIDNHKKTEGTGKGI